MRLFAILAATTVVAFASAQWFMVRVNPEVKFWSSLRATQIESAERTKDLKRIVFVGGSSCAFSIVPKEFQIEGYEVINAGAAAAAGSDYLVNAGASLCRKGDVLVVALERHLLTGEAGSRAGLTQLGVALSREAEEPTLAYEALSARPVRDFLEETTVLRPGFRFGLTYALKKALGRPDYRYNSEDIQPDGRVQLQSSEQHTFLPDGPFQTSALSSEGHVLLSDLFTWSKEEEVTVFLTLPLLYVEESALSHNRTANDALLSEVSRWVHPLRDEELAVTTDRSLFADSVYHLTGDAARARSRQLSALLGKFVKD